jgi:hypothetical protein
MRITTEALSTGIVVRRVSTGAAPFRWEVYRGADASIDPPIYISSDRFRSMHEAYRAGQARLGDFISKRSQPPGVTNNRERQSRHVGQGVYETRAC